MHQAKYYFDYHLSCLELGYEHEAQIYLNDSWLFLFEAAMNGEL